MTSRLQASKSINAVLKIALIRIKRPDNMCAGRADQPRGAACGFLGVILASRQAVLIARYVWLAFARRHSHQSMAISAGVAAMLKGLNRDQAPFVALLAQFYQLAVNNPVFRTRQSENASRINGG
jgi:hypothetical protein